MLKGKIAFVTGASSGFGYYIAKTFAQAGANLILLARRKDRIDALAAELSSEFGVECVTLECDVRSYDQVNTAFESLEPKWKDNVDILVNNAGLARGTEKIQDGVLSNWEEMIDANVKGLLYVSRTVLPKMIARGSGHVINIGSIAGHELYPGGNVYCATKHAVKAITKGMALDVNGLNIRVCSIDPGLAETEFAKVRFHGDEDKAKSVYTGMDPLVGQDVADIALFVASRPAHVNIQNVLVTPTAQASANMVHRKA